MTDQRNIEIKFPGCGCLGLVLAMVGLAAVMGKFG